MVETNQGENLAQLLDLYRLQRHDFLNHFQVAMGYIQLGKGQAALDYLRQAAEQAVQMAPLAQARPPEMALELLELARRCAEHDVVFAVNLPQSSLCPPWTLEQSKSMEIVRDLITAAAGVELGLQSAGGHNRLTLRVRGVNQELLEHAAANLRQLGAEVENLGRGKDASDSMNVDGSIILG